MYRVWHHFDINTSATFFYRERYIQDHPPTPFRVDVFSKFSSNFFKQCIMEHFGDSDSSRREKLAEIMASILRTSSNTLIGSAVDASYTLKAVFKQHVRIQQQK